MWRRSTAGCPCWLRGCPSPYPSRWSRSSGQGLSPALVGLHLAGRHQPESRRRLFGLRAARGRSGGVRAGAPPDRPGGRPARLPQRTLASRDPAVREALAALGGVLDRASATAVWNEALTAEPFTDRPVWVHGDLQPGNVLVADGRLTAVIDFGCTGLADPAVDLIAAWYLLTAGARETFRTAVAADDATWTRGRGWALSIALMELAHYRDTNPVMASIAARVIEEILAEAAERA